MQVTNRIGFKSDSILYDTATVVGQFENNDIWNIKTINSDEELFAIKKDDTFVSHIFGQLWQFNGNKYFILADTATNTEYQKQGLATSLYMFLLQKKKIKILSDKQQTKHGELLCQSMQRHYPNRVKLLDTQTGKTLNRNAVPDSELYIDSREETTQSQRYRLVLENLQKNIVPIVGIDILNERLIYTHPDNIGIYE